MLAFPVVEHLYVLKAGGLHVGMAAMRHAMYSFVLEAVEPTLGLQRNQAIVRASVTISAVMRGLSDQPTPSRLNKSSTMARYSQPLSVHRQVMSEVQT